MSTPIWFTEYRNVLLAKGLCVQCGKAEAMKDHTTCGYCNEFINEKNQRIYSRNKANGMCVRHSKVKAEPGRSSCILCLERDRGRKQKRKRVAK